MAQEKNVAVERLTPASLSHNDNVPKISNIGMPAENPRNSITQTDFSDHQRAGCSVAISVLLIALRYIDWC